MSQFDAYKCDECGAIKGDVNHWWQFVRVPGPRIVIFGWDCPVRDENAAALVKHLCGIECVMKTVSRELKQEKQ